MCVDLSVMLLTCLIRICFLPPRFRVRQINVHGLVLAGSADFKKELSQSDMFDPRLQVCVCVGGGELLFE